MDSNADYKARFFSLQSRYFELVRRYLDVKNTNSTLEVKNEILESFLKQKYGDDFDNFVSEHNKDQLDLANFDSKNELATLFREITNAQKAAYFDCEEKIQVIDLEIKVEGDGKDPVQNIIIPEIEASKQCGICSEIFDCSEHALAHLEVHKRYPDYFNSKIYQNGKRKSKSQLLLEEAEPIEIETKIQKSSAFGYHAKKVDKVNELKLKLNFSSDERLFSKSDQMETTKILEIMYPWYTSDHVEILMNPVVLL